MSKKKSESIPFTTPFGTLRYPKVSAPDTKGEYADNKFKTDIVFSDADYAIVEKAIKEAAAKLLPDVKNPKLPLHTWDEGSGIRLKSQYRPVVFDTKNAKLPETVLIGGGTIARIASAIFAYKKGGNTGISLRLGKVQVKELVEYQGGDASPFEETEGFVSEGGETSDDSFDSL
jgi:DNA-directed RNA polymerase